MATTKKNYNRLSDAQIAEEILSGGLSDIEERKKILGNRYEAIQYLVTNKLMTEKKITSPKKGEDAIVKDIANGKWGTSEIDIKKRLNMLGYTNDKEILKKADTIQQKKYKELAEQFNSKKISYVQLLEMLDKEKINYSKVQPYVRERSGDIQVGDYVQIKQGATDLKTGKAIPNYVIQSQYLVKKTNRKTVTIGDKFKEMGVIDKNFIIKQ